VEIGLVFKREIGGPAEKTRVHSAGVKRIKSQGIFRGGGKTNTWESQVFAGGVRTGSANHPLWENRMDFPDGLGKALKGKRMQRGQAGRHQKRVKWAVGREEWGKGVGMWKNLVPPGEEGKNGKKRVTLRLKGSLQKRDWEQGAGDGERYACQDSENIPSGQAGKEKAGRICLPLENPFAPAHEKGQEE